MTITKDLLILDEKKPAEIAGFYFNKMEALTLFRHHDC